MVTIPRDSWGVPHVFADDLRGVYYGYGYVVAEDRLFQIDMARRSFTDRGIFEGYAADGTPDPHAADQLALCAGFGRKRQWITRAEVAANARVARVLHLNT